MAASDAFDALAQACLDTHDAILKHGSSEMQAASRLLLYALAEEIRRRDGTAPPPRPVNDDD